MTTPKLIALDIDGTLIGSNKKVPAFTSSELQRISDEYGIPIVIITARGPESAAIIAEQAGISASFVTHGGCLVWALEPSGSYKVLSESFMNQEKVQLLVEIGQRAGIHTGLYSLDEWHVNTLDYWGLREARNTSVWPTSVGRINETVLGEEKRFCKVMYRGDKKELDDMKSEIQQVSEGLFVHRSPHVIEIIPAEAVKLPSLMILAEYFGIHITDIIAFGDSQSDLEMLESVGIGVLMANASKNLVLSKPLLRTLSNDEDGVGVALRQVFPTNRPFRT